MKTQFLFSNKMKPIGWVLFFPSLVLGIIHIYSGFEFSFLEVGTKTGNIFPSSQNLTDEIALVGVLLGLVFIGFSKLKTEDEYVQKIRLDSLLWATYLNIGLIILSTLLVYSDGYFEVMTYNLFALPLFFVIRFHYYLSRR